MEAQAITIEKPFSESAAVFAALVGRLGDRALEATHHGAIEELLRVEGQELLRVLYEDHMNLRAQAILEEREVVGVDGKIRTHRREMPRKQMSIFGAIEIGGRTGWRAEGATALSPFDAQLNMPPGIHSHGVRRRVAELASKLAFDGVAEELGKTSGASVGKRQLEELTRDIGKDFDAFYKAKAAEPVDPSATLQIGGVDATGVVMLPEALREATRRAREAEVEDAAGERWPKPKSTRDVQRNGMRMAGVSVVYEVAPYERTALDILRDLRPVEVVPNANPRPRPQAKRVSASVIKPMRLVVRETFDEMERRDPNHDKRWVLLVDGAEHPLDVIEAEAKRRRVEITILLDFIHVAQYVWDAAKVLVPDNEAERRKWVAEKLTLVLWGESSTAAAAMRRSATKRALPTKERKPIDTCADYLLKYGPYLRYHLALRDGLPITTGVVEGACRHLVKDRMDITGARWGLDTAEAVLRLRSLKSSGDIDDYFTFHEALELQRNHLSRYADANPPSLVRPGRPNLKLVT